MRRNIQLTYSDKEHVFLYTHWGAEGLEETLAYSLDRARERWADPSYLARIIFSDMTMGVGKQLTGFGLAPYIMDDQYPTLQVKLHEHTVNGVPYEAFISKPSMFAV